MTLALHTQHPKDSCELTRDAHGSKVKRWMASTLQAYCSPCSHSTHLDSHVVCDALSDEGSEDVKASTVQRVSNDLPDAHDAPDLWVEGLALCVSGYGKLFHLTFCTGACVWRHVCVCMNIRVCLYTCMCRCRNRRVPQIQSQIPALEYIRPVSPGSCTTFSAGAVQLQWSVCVEECVHG